MQHRSGATPLICDQQITPSSGAPAAFPAPIRSAFSVAADIDHCVSGELIS